jgi:serine/threonine protein kinase
MRPPLEGLGSGYSLAGCAYERLGIIPEEMTRSRRWLYDVRAKSTGRQYILKVGQLGTELCRSEKDIYDIARDSEIPNVLTPLSSWEHTNSYYIVLPRRDMDLFQWVVSNHSHHSLDDLSYLSNVVNIALHVGETVKSFHARNILLGDIKLENVVLDRVGDDIDDIAVIDFDDTLDLLATKQPVFDYCYGTAGCRAPEYLKWIYTPTEHGQSSEPSLQFKQLGGAGWFGRCSKSVALSYDVWSYGCMLYKMLYGKHPISDELKYSANHDFSTFSIKQPPVKVVAGAVGEIVTRMQKLLSRILIEEPEKRPSMEFITNEVHYIKTVLIDGP